MDPDFWHSRWQDGRIGFHEGRVNRMLEAHLDALHLAPGSRVFVPLCGKAVDIPWLLSRGHRVTGCELSEIAVRELFDQMGGAPEVSEDGPHRRYMASGLEIFAGDLFALDAGRIGPVEAVYDRAALVALPADMRPLYAAHVAELTDTVPQLVVTFEYDQSGMEGPPFAVTEAELRALYGDRFGITVLADAVEPGGLKGIIPARKKAVLLHPGG